MCGPFHAMVVNPNVVGERMKILWYAVFLKSWLRLVLFWFTLVSSSVCLVFFFTSLESKDLKMFISKDIFYQQVKLYMAFSMIIEQQHTIFPHVRPTGVIFFSLPFIQSSQYIRPKVIMHKGASIIRTWVLFEGGPYLRKCDKYLFSPRCYPRTSDYRAKIANK